MKAWLSSLLSPDDRVSSKRVVTLIAAMLLYVSFLADMLFEITIQEAVYEGMLYLAIAGLGTTALEKVTQSKKKESTSSLPDQPPVE